MRPIDLAACYDKGAVVAVLIKAGARLGSMAAEIEQGVSEEQSPPLPASSHTPLHLACKRGCPSAGTHSQKVPSLVPLHRNCTRVLTSEHINMYMNMRQRAS
jgi:hypothetical protein